VVSADQFFETPNGYKHDASKLDEAHTDCFKRFLNIFRRFVNVIGFSSVGGDEVIVDNTNIEAFEIAPYYLGAKAYGWDVVIVEFRPTLRVDPPSLRINYMKWAEKCWKRNSHGVPENIHRRMAEKFFYGPGLPSFWNVEIFRGD
jgi:hypothetical protein